MFKFHLPHYLYIEFSEYLMNKEWDSATKG